MTGLIILTVALHAISLRNDFVFDDVGFVQQNPHIRSLGNLGRFFAPGFWREAWPGRSYRPVVEVTLALNLAVTGEQPAGLRAVNVALLAATAALVYWLAWRLAGSVLAALIAGLVFAVHPAHIETITLVKNRSELLAGLFGLLALLWFLRAVERRGRWRLAWLGSAAATAAALGSKEVALALPLVLTAAALALVPAGRRRRALAMTVPAWLLAVGLVVLLFHWLPERYPRPPATDRLAVLEFAALGPAVRGLVTIKTVGTYLGLLVWPFAPCAERAFAIPRDLWHMDIVASLAACLALAVLLVWLWRRSRVAAFAVLWTVVAIAPVANLAPVAVRPIAEQRLLGATIPFALLIGLALVRKSKRGQTPFRKKGSDLSLVGRVTATVVVVLVVVVAMGVVTVRTLPAWRTGLALWERTARQSPRVWRARYNYGMSLVEVGRHRAAVAQFEWAVALDDLQPEALTYLAHGLATLGRYHEAKPISRLALAWQPDGALSHATLAWALLEERAPNAAVAEARLAVGLEPDGARHHELLGLALAQAGRYAEAIPSFRRARDLQPRYPERWLNLAAALERAGRLDEAFVEYLAVAQRWAGRPPAGAAQAGIDRIQRRLSRN